MSVCLGNNKSNDKFVGLPVPTDFVRFVFVASRIRRKTVGLSVPTNSPTDFVGLSVHRFAYMDDSNNLVKNGRSVGTDKFNDITRRDL